MLEEVERVLKERGFRCLLKDGELVVPFKDEEFVAKENGEAYGVVYDTDLNCESMKRLLGIPTRYRVSVGVDDDNDVVVRFWGLKDVESIVGAIILFLEIVKLVRFGRFELDE